jgi:hypothetical protein
MEWNCTRVPIYSIPYATRCLILCYEILFPRVCRRTDSKYGERNLYRILIRRSGITRVLDRIAALANSSPNGNFIIDSGIENIVGRDRTFPTVDVKSAFVIGLGDTAFTGPAIDL